MKGQAHARWAAVYFLACLAPLAAHAYDETRDAWIRGCFTGHSPRVVVAPAAGAWQQAQELAARTPDSFILVGGGRSMHPLYPSGTILVLRAADYADLRSGQTVVYRNAAGRAVAHVLLARARDGWRVRGLNNRTHDPEPVVAANLIGLVAGAFLPAEKPERTFAATAPRHRTLFLDDADR